MSDKEIEQRKEIEKKIQKFQKQKQKEVHSNENKEKEVSKKNKTKVEKENSKLVKDFLEEYENDLLKNAIKFRYRYGPGALFIPISAKSLKSKEMDISYYHLGMLSEKFRAHVVDNPERNRTVHYLIQINGGDYVMIDRTLTKALMEGLAKAKQ